MSENKLKHGKIYKIVDVGYNKCYIGSTCESLSQRMARHRKDFRRWKNDKRNSYSLFDIFDEYGVENCKIELIEKCDVQDKEELRKQEGFHIKGNDCVNKMITGRTRRQRYEDNKEKELLQCKLYRETHQDEIKQYHQKRYQEKKDILAEKAKAKMTCCCGATIRKTGRIRHEKSQKHQDYLKQNSEVNEEQ